MRPAVVTFKFYRDTSEGMDLFKDNYLKEFVAFCREIDFIEKKDLRTLSATQKEKIENWIKEKTTLLLNQGIKLFEYTVDVNHIIVKCSLLDENGYYSVKGDIKVEFGLTSVVYTVIDTVPAGVDTYSLMIVEGDQSKNIKSEKKLDGKIVHCFGQIYIDSYKSILV